MIPKTFNLGGFTITVREDNTLHEQDVIGRAEYMQQEILIDKKYAPKETTEQCFYHELVHWIFYIMGEDDLRTNEKLVDNFAHYLYQYEKTKKMK